MGVVREVGGSRSLRNVCWFCGRQFRPGQVRGVVYRPFGGVWRDGTIVRTGCHILCGARRLARWRRQCPGTAARFHLVLGRDRWGRVTFRLVPRDAGGRIPPAVRRAA